MTSLHGKLFAATQRGNLMWRDPVGFDAPWQVIGHAQLVKGLAAINDKLFAVGVDKLWWHEAAYSDMPWHHFGKAEGLNAMAALNNKLYAVTQDGKLITRNV